MCEIISLENVDSNEMFSISRAKQLLFEIEKDLSSELEALSKETEIGSFFYFSVGLSLAFHSFFLHFLRK